MTDFKDKKLNIVETNGYRVIGQLRTNHHDNSRTITEHLNTSKRARLVKEGIYLITDEEDNQMMKLQKKGLSWFEIVKPKN